ncbi:MAG: type II toxin-antitoxin system RelE/ParE family toxin [Gammaproteobacteria bacterium]
MTEFFLSPIAEQDIDGIVSYIAEENPVVAMDLLDKLYAAMEMLAANSLIGHKREDITDKAVRFWTVKWHYLIVYKDSSPIEIVRVLSGYRDITRLLS